MCRWPASPDDRHKVSGFLEIPEHPRMAPQLARDGVIGPQPRPTALSFIMASIPSAGALGGTVKAAGQAK